MSGYEQLATTGFTNGAIYEAGRPGYPQAVVDLFATLLELTPGVRVLDLGAGTGKLTRQIFALGVSIVAVEPSADMREQFAHQLPDVPVFKGTGELIPITDNAVDVVLIAQAFHWFEPAKAIPEIHRVLAPGGRIGLVWNERDERVGWVHDLSVAMRWPERQPYQVGMDFRPILASTGHFVNIERHQFMFGQTLDHATLLQRVQSTSYISAMQESERAALMSAVKQVVNMLPEHIVLPYVTDAYVGWRGEKVGSGAL